ncbi:DUF2474 domain-containing protein [Fulvimarina endophytica]|uniref:DUF2474 domain-containing protein n=2 Tax=Fulvimarina endophytica TaxID=2293836 RepID=A0A371X5P2_9HYPH|nr:DUF2474 domain-containing protein [Fulvimarina endophytica]
MAPRDEVPATGLGRRLGWFALYWLASVAVIAVVAYAIRWMIVP